jgi:phosphopentomutase
VERALRAIGGRSVPARHHAHSEDKVMTRAVILMLDSFGIGATADAERFGDAGADTFGHIARQRADRGRPLAVPNLARLGLLHAAHASTGRFPPGCAVPDEVTGAWGYARELSSGKDTPSGHWEMAGVPVLFEWGYFRGETNTFPGELLDAIIERAGLPGVLGNCHASGTEIIKELGEEHMRTGKPIVYTSADSVFQIAAHEEAFGLQRLYELCDIARELVDAYNVGRVIARPFVGTNRNDFVRTGNRRDLTTPPPSDTVLDKLAAAGGEVIGIGKIPDIYANRGVTRRIKATGNAALFDATLQAWDGAPDRSIVFTNFVDFDMLYGHRRDVEGYAAALESFDARLPELTSRLRDDDLLVLCADHGCDPTWPGSDHTREHIPVLASGAGLAPGPLGERATFADIGQTLAEFFGLEAMAYGESFL